MIDCPPHRNDRSQEEPPHERSFGPRAPRRRRTDRRRVRPEKPHLRESAHPPIKDPKPLLADYPAFVAPIEEVARFEAPRLVDDEDADLHVRAWRFSYNARGIIEMPNRLRAAETAVIVVHPWGIDDGQGWKTPEPAGANEANAPTCAT